MGWWLLLTIPPILAVLVYFLPICIYVDYDSEGLRAKARLGLLVFHLYPGSGEGKIEFSWSDKSDSMKKSANGKRPTGGLYQEILQYARFARDFFGDLRRKLVIRKLCVNITQADEDPFTLAMKYGGTCIAASTLLALVNETFTVKKKSVVVDCDFLADQTLVAANLVISISVGRFLRLYAKFSKRYHKEFSRKLIIKKAVQTNESESS